MIPVGDILVSNDIATTHFACDLGGCRGACCTMPGGTGAPLEASELPLIERAATLLAGELTREGLEVIRRRGAWESVGRDEYATTCVGDRACVFVVYHGSVAKCAIQIASEEGRTDWPKPLSCHLFPIRVGDFDQHQVLNYEPIVECKSGIARGRRKHIRLELFLRVPLVRLYGEDWYREFLAACEAKRHALG